MDLRTLRFELYRYQLLPRSRFVQADLVGDSELAPIPETVEELLRRKNELFKRALLSLKGIHLGDQELAYGLLSQDKDSFIVRIAPDRSVRIETRDFHREHVDSWPSVLLFVWNKPDKQLIAVQRRTEAFQHATTAVGHLVSAMNNRLQHTNLRVHIEPIFEQQAFWDLIAEHKRRVQQIEFQLITPNMSNISASLSQDLKDLAKSTNTVRTDVRITADPTSTLEITKNNEQLQNLVKYASAGGGNISLKVRGLRRRVTTSDSIQEVELTVDEIEMHGDRVGNISKALKELLK